MRNSVVLARPPSYRHYETFSFCEFFLVPVEGKKLPGFYDKRGCYVKNVKATMPTGESVGS